MLFTSLALSTLTSAASARSFLPSLPESIFSNPDSSFTSIPSIHESAIQARRILHLENIGTLSTVFPSDNHHASSSHSSAYEIAPFENRPSGLGGTPIGLMDYFADCEPDSGNPTILAISIATSFKNVDAGSNITLSLRWHPQDGKWRSEASLPRFSLMGYLEEIDDQTANKEGLRSCFVKSHPDSVAWMPGNRIHESRWVRLVVEQVYWIGGFGDRAYIGWIPAEQWRNVTMEEVESCSLPGEKKSSWSWREWL